MTDKLRYYSTMRDETAVTVAGSEQNWIYFLTTAARFYKYPFKDQILIYAQRPNATACASYELWNNIMHRYVKRGTHGIALLDEESEGKGRRLRYVYDISDTGERENSRQVEIWQMLPEYEQLIISELDETYNEGVHSTVNESLKCAASILINDYWESVIVKKHDILALIDSQIHNVNNGFSIRENFIMLATDSAFYETASRCGTEKYENYLNGSFKSCLPYFTDPDAIIVLGSAASYASSQILRTIETFIKKQEREKTQTFEQGRSNIQNDRNRINEEESDRQGSTSGHNSDSLRQGTDISLGGRLSDSGSGNESDGGEATGQVRQNEADISEGKRSSPVRNVVLEGRDTSASLGNSGHSQPESRTDHERSAGSKSRTGQTDRPDGLGTAYEQSEGSGRGDSDQGADIQLSFLAPAEYEPQQNSNNEGPGDIPGPSSAPVEDRSKDDTEMRQKSDNKLNVEDKSDQKSDPDSIKSPADENVSEDVHVNGKNGPERYTWLDRLHVGDCIYLNNTAFIVEKLNRQWNKRSDWEVTMRDPTLFYPISRVEHADYIETLLRQDERNGFLFMSDSDKSEQAEQIPRKSTSGQVGRKSVSLNDGSGDKKVTAVSVKGESLKGNTDRADLVSVEKDWKYTAPLARNFRIKDEHLGEGGPKQKYSRNIRAIKTLFQIENENRQATPEEQETLSQYVGWGGLSDVFDPEKSSWADEYRELKDLLSDEEYRDARASTLNAHYTSPVVISAIYDAVEKMGFSGGNILEPSMGIGNFFGMLPEELQESQLYGVELDSISGRIAQKLYPNADITIAGFEMTEQHNFYDLAVGNVPFGNYKVNDRAYNKLNFSIHNYFFAKALDQVRPGGLIVFVTSKYTLDAKSPEARKYLAQRAEFLGAIRLPNNAFLANAGTSVVSDIIFLQKRDYPIDIDPDWVHLGLTDDNFSINSYFADHPEMILGRLVSEDTQYGREDCTVVPFEDTDLSVQLSNAVSHIAGNYRAESQNVWFDDMAEPGETGKVIPARAGVKNLSYTVVDGEIYYRENSIMILKDQLSTNDKKRLCALINLRQIVDELIEYQMDDVPEEMIVSKQIELNSSYDAFRKEYGFINSRTNSRIFSADPSYYLLCSLEVFDEDGKFKCKADMFTKRTIRPDRQIASVDTSSDALTVSISERGRVDLPYMADLLGTPGEYGKIIEELKGVIFKDPAGSQEFEQGWQTADEYLSGNVREKLRIARSVARENALYEANVQFLEKAQPKDLSAAEIGVRLGATWIDKEYIQQFMNETFKTPRSRNYVRVEFSELTATWQVSGKESFDWDINDVAAHTTYGTDKVNAYRILEETLNLKDVRVYDTKRDENGNDKRVLNKKETTLAQQKQQAIKDTFKDWIWKDPDRRADLVAKYNNLFNANRPREYDGSHIRFSGMNPEISLKEHQKNAIAHILYGGNTLLAHEVGAGKTFEMVASAMELKRLGLCHKSLFVVPNHLTMQWASEFLRLYPSANILVATKKDFETSRRKKFCARIATGDYDAVIIGQSQFEKIPVSKKRQERLLREQIEDITATQKELYSTHSATHFTVKQIEKTKRSLESRLNKLLAADKKDDVITFEQLGVDRLFVDESQAYKNLFLYTKMQNVAGLSTSESQRSADMFMKCRYMDEITGGRGVVFASGTPVSNSMTELYSLMRYLQYDTLQKMGLGQFDCWASTFGECTTSIELAPEGTGYRARTRFSRFYNLPELMNLFKEAADIKTSDQLNLPVPKANYKTIVVEPSDIQKEMVASLSERAAKVHKGLVDSSKDNMLCITSDGRKIGLDQRLIDPMLPDDPDSKLNACVSNILKIYAEGNDKKLTQLLFCDMSTPKSDGTFNVYDDIRKKLVSGGIPNDEIAFIHDANTESKKSDLFARVRSGHVRILMGSTQKMGAGTNVQDRLIAVHHLDVGWRPADMTQRNGRIIRQGNMNPEVYIFNYVTNGTFDAYLFQTLENKQKFISQIMTSKSPVRSCEDVDEQVLSYAEIKALCAGDDRIREKMELDIEVAKLKEVKADYQSQQYYLEDQLLKYFPEQIEKQKSLISGLREDLQTADLHPLPDKKFVGMNIQGKLYDKKEEAGKAILSACGRLKNCDPVPLGVYRGFTMNLSYDAINKTFQITLKGKISHHVVLGDNVFGNITRLDNAIAGIAKKISNAQEQLDNLEMQQTAARSEIGKPFAQEKELAEKSNRLAELDAVLNLDDRVSDISENVSEDQKADAENREEGSVLDALKNYRNQIYDKYKNCNDGIQPPQFSEPSEVAI